MSLVLNPRELSDVECILDGSYHPVKGFMTRSEYDLVVSECKLPDGSLWPIPIVLHVTKTQHKALDIQEGKTIILRDDTSLPVAEMTVSESYQPDYLEECKKVYGTVDTNHPSVKRIISQDGMYVSGKLSPIHGVKHYDFQRHRRTPAQVKEMISQSDWKIVVGFQTRNPMHRSHFELTLEAMRMAGPEAKLLLHPVVGDTQECDIDYVTRCQCYEKILPYYPKDQALLSLLNYSMRMGGPREALMHAIIRKNYGCTHFIIGRDHAGPSYKTKEGDPFYKPYDAQDFVKKYEKELGISIIACPNIQYVEGTGFVLESSITSKDEPKVQNLSGTQLRDMLRTGQSIPEWYTFPEIADTLRQVSSASTGLCIYIIGLPSSGKTTYAQALKARLMQDRLRPISVLDGDVVRRNLGQGLGFSKEDRSINVRRIGFVAGEIVRHGGLAICANIAPYEEDRCHNRQLIEKMGRYIEIFVDTPLSTCEQRDVKGLYRAAREGRITGMTGVDDPFETPLNSDLILDGESIEDGIEQILSLIG